MIESPELFFVAPFGRRPTSIGSAREIDFDFVFQSLISTVAAERGWSATRGDQLFTGDSVMEAVIDALYRAHLVVADITLPNANVYYELGIRHAIAAGGTVLIAHRGTELPFDVAHRHVLSYDLDEPDGFRQQLAACLNQHAALQGESTGRGVRAALERLGVVTGANNEVRFEQDFSARIERAENVRQLIAVWQWARQHEGLPSRHLAELARRLHRHREWKTAAEVLERATRDRPGDFELRRTFGWTLRKLGRLREAEEQLRGAVTLNGSDPEAWGILGGLLKEQNRLEEAAAAYQKSVAFAPDDEYVLVNLACVEVLLGDERRKAGVERYRTLKARIAARSGIERDVWADLTEAEAAFIAGEDERAHDLYVAAGQRPGVSWELDSAAKQLALFASVGFRPADAERLIAEMKSSRAAPGAPPPASAPAPDLVATLSVSVAAPAAATAPAARPPVFIHLSDLHFGTRPTAGGGQEPMHRFVQTDSSKSLLEHMVDQIASFSFGPDELHLVISGDLTYTATQSEFQEALLFIQKLCEALGINEKERVAVTPGNHDVSWPAANYQRARRFDQYLIFLRKLYGKELAARLYPRIDWSLDPEIPVDGSNLFAFHSLANGAVELISLNSCVHENEADHWGFVGEKQLEKLGKELPPIADETKGPVRLAVMHHHLHVFPEAQDAHLKEPWLDVSLARDAGAVERWIEEHRFSIFMHGHKHKPQLRETIIRGYRQNRDEDGRPLIVCGAGSAGVHPRELEPNFGNHFEVIEILRTPRSPGADFARITWRELPTDSDVFWTKRPPWVIKG